jgi:tetratricopeptide (TPR) repeat protein
MTLAIQDSDRCIAADPKFIKGCVGHPAVQVDGVVARCTRALTCMCPRIGGCRYLRKGRILLITEQWTDAVKVYTIALELDPHNYDARTGLDKAKTGNVLLSKTAASRAEEAMQNKEIRQIWEEFRWLLELMTKDPESRKVKKELEDPLVRSKLAKLRAAGLM